MIVVRPRRKVLHRSTFLAFCSENQKTESLEILCNVKDGYVDRTTPPKKNTRGANVLKLVVSSLKKKERKINDPEIELTFRKINRINFATRNAVQTPAFARVSNSKIRNAFHQFRFEFNTVIFYFSYNIVGYSVYIYENNEFYVVFV